MSDPTLVAIEGQVKQLMETNGHLRRALEEVRDIAAAALWASASSPRPAGEQALKAIVVCAQRELSPPLVRWRGGRG